MRIVCFFFSSRRRHTRWTGDWSSDVCSSDLDGGEAPDEHDRGHRSAHVALAAGAGERRVTSAEGKGGHGGPDGHRPAGPCTHERGLWSDRGPLPGAILPAAGFWHCLRSCRRGGLLHFSPLDGDYLLAETRKEGCQQRTAA